MKVNPPSRERGATRFSRNSSDASGSSSNRSATRYATAARCLHGTDQSGQEQSIAARRRARGADEVLVVHDPELDEAVIAFANADFDQCEGSLSSLIAPGGPRTQHAETWLVLFDLYRATGQQQRFESLALDYAQQFGWSAPQWFSLPRLVAEAVSDERAPANSRCAAALSGQGRVHAVSSIQAMPG